MEVRTNTIVGLKQVDYKEFDDLLAKANLIQLAHMSLKLAKEQENRINQGLIL